MRRRVGTGATLLGVIVGALAVMTAPSGATHQPGHVEVSDPITAENKLNLCNGALPTDGSGNTDKRLIGGTLVPGGTAVFEFTYPFDPTDTSGRQDFEILDCVFVNGEPIIRYDIHGVPNTVSPFVFQVTVNIPMTVPVGAEFCNIGKTTAAPSSAQGSNRKAGPACFVVGGDLRVVKVDPAGAPLNGATFSVVCTPASTLLPVIIEGQTGTTYTGGTGADNAIAISGPLGTPCVVTETAAPPGYVLATPASVTAAIGVDATVTFVNPPAVGSLAITKVSDTPGSFTFSVTCPGTSVTDQSVTIAVAAAGQPGATSAPIAGIPTGTVCTVTEQAAAGFEPRDPQTVTIALGTNTVTFSNVRLTGTLVVAKTTDGGTGTFTFTVDCNPGTTFDQTFQLTDTETRRITGIPTGTTCTVTEAPNSSFASAVTPGDGTVVIGTGDNAVSFTNTALPPVLAIAKTADAGSVTAGGSVGYTVTVTNTGKGSAVGATLSDPLPTLAGVSWSISPAYAGPGTCSVTGAAPAQSLECSFGNLAAGASATVHVSSATAAATAGTLVNTAMARAANFGPVTATATIAVTVPTVVLGQVVTQAQTAPETTVAPTTTTTTSTTTTTTSAPATTTTTIAPQVLSQSLPRTGANVWTLLIVALGLIGLGVVLRRTDRRTDA